MSRERTHIENHLLIEDKNRKIVRFRLNSIQAKYDEERTNRDIILKARQEGFSSLILAYFLIDCIKTPNTRSVVVSHETGATQKLLDRVKRYIERFYSGDEFVKIPLSYNNRSELYFPETNSSFYIGTAGSRSFGRGDVIHNLHLSEFAFYDNPEELLTGILPAVPKDGRVVIETTANGFNFFKTLWEKSKRGESVFKPHFFPWWMHNEYKVAGDCEPTEEEESLINRFKLVIPQINWRREKMREYPSIDKFQQEFPADDFEAFISSGRPVFNTQILKDYLAISKPPLRTGYVNEEGQWTDDEKGYVSIYEEPQQGKYYVIGADVAEGKEESDSSSAHVMERESMRVVAHWHGHIDPDLFADQLIGLSRFYNGAVIGCEVNNQGLVTNMRLRDKKYNAVYKRQRFNTVKNKTTDEYGWRTDMRTKDIMIGDLAQAIREEVLEIYDKLTIEELLAYQRDEKGHTNAPEGMHDDRVISLALAIQMRKLTSPMDYTKVKVLPPNSVGRMIQEMRRSRARSKNYIVK